MKVPIILFHGLNICIMKLCHFPQLYIFKTNTFAQITASMPLSKVSKTKKIRFQTYTILVGQLINVG